VNAVAYNEKAVIKPILLLQGFYAVVLATGTTTGL